MTKFEKLEYLIENFSTPKRAVENFSTKLSADPADAFSWGDDAMKAAAQLCVGSKLRQWVDLTRKNRPDENDAGIAEIVLREVHAEVLRNARWPSMSSSAVSNLMAVYVNAAMAEVVERIMFDR
jgi:hypothetical protein